MSTSNKILIAVFAIPMLWMTSVVFQAVLVNVGRNVFAEVLRAVL